MIHHLACIMDGNRRWARQHSLVPWLGHRYGLYAAQRVVDFCLLQGIPFLSLYTFSIENFSRPSSEREYLFGGLAHELYREVDSFIAKQVCIKFIGDRTLFPKTVVPLCNDIEQRTVHCRALTVSLLFCYGGRQELTAAVRAIAHKVASGALTAEAITPALLAEHLWTADIPEPDLIIRTGGVRRLSNFLLYQAAYSELYMLDCLWPEITAQHLQQAVDYFERCQRNFGR